MNSAKIKLAIFDIDGTIFRSSLAVELIHELVAQGIFPQKAFLEIEVDYLAWLNRKGTYENYLGQLINLLLKYLPGSSEHKVKAIGQDILTKKREQVYRYTRDLIHKFYAKKYHLLAVSGSPNFLVEDFAGSFNFHASFGTEFIVEHGKFTGGVLKIGDQDKLKTVQSYLAQKHLQADWPRSFAIGDTLSDATLLAKVGHPIAFNPNQGLATLARKKHWPIVIERKDCIYALQKFNLLV